MKFFDFAWDRRRKALAVFWLAVAVLGLSLGFGLTLPQQIRPDDLRPFRSDTCSRFPNGTPWQSSLWCRCCVAHDIAYWRGGTRAERLDADLGLERCVAGVGQPELARLMLAGVQVGGSPYWLTDYRWGYGWPYLRGYKPVSDAEQQAVERLLQQVPETAIMALCE